MIAIGVTIARINPVTFLKVVIGFVYEDKEIDDGDEESDDGGDGDCDGDCDDDEQVCGGVIQHAAQKEGSSATQGGVAVSSTGVGALQITVQGKTALLSAGLVSLPSSTQHLFSQ
ncbi:hypothetical protein SUGI_0624510 [Cryptomeria japonica]|nr:hypothetical protein SUGI_0624510 [Cryptomeria japonica]